MGDTLVEVLIAIVIIGITATAVLAGFATSIASSAIHRQYANIDTALRSYASAATYELQQQPNPDFTQCATPASYQVVSAYPSNASPSSQIEVFGTGFTSNAPVSISIGGTSVTADITSGKKTSAIGNVAAVITLPSSGMTAGSDALTVSAGALSGTGAFTVSSGAPVSSDLAGYGLAMAPIQYWNGTSFVSKCTQSGNSPQLLTVTATTTTATADSLSFVIINPQFFSSSIPVFDSESSTSFVVGDAGSFTVRSSGLPTPSLAETGALPTGVTFADNHNGTATLSGTPASGTSGLYSITLTANNGVLPNATQTFVLSVDGPPSITSATSASFEANSAGSFTVTTSSVPTAALTESGALPTGVTFVDNGDGTATLSGMPAASSLGVFTLTIKASDGIAPDATQTFTLTVDAPPAITSSTTATFTVGTDGSFTVTTTGFPTATLSYTGTLPSTVTLVNNGNGTATISGVPASGTGNPYPITITASNGVAPNATQSFTLVVDQPPAFTSAANPPSSPAGKAGSFTVTTSGYPAVTITNSLTLPSGVTFTDTGGTAMVTWTKKASAGTITLHLTATNGIAPAATQTLTVVLT